MKNKKFFLLSIFITILMIFFIMLSIFIVDPFFHYHKPINGLSYKLYNGRYQNIGILKNFDYDTVIIGTSLTQNFKNSELDTLFNTNSVKASFPGATYKELNDSLVKGIKYNDKIKNVFRLIDFNAMLRDKDEMIDYNFPTYLYDDNIFNDVNYLLNKQVIFKDLFEIILNTMK
ncbi:MAG: hypothetical protein ACRCZK_03730, partial [Oscillospiraceae bacterium]